MKQSEPRVHVVSIDLYWTEILNRLDEMVCVVEVELSEVVFPAWWED